LPALLNGPIDQAGHRLVPVLRDVLVLVVLVLVLVVVLLVLVVVIIIGAELVAVMWPL
jgi:hypothetical protein